MTWLNSAAHARWLEAETDRLINFAAGSKVPTGFGWLDNNGKVFTDSRPICGSPPGWSTVSLSPR